MMIIAFFKKRDVYVITQMIIGTLIYSIGLVWILNLGGFYAGGVTGISQLLSTILGNFDINISMSVFIAILNLPIFFIGYKGVSKKFAILSIYSVIIQVVVIAILEYLMTQGLNPLRNIEASGDILTLSILGGLVIGIGSGMILRVGASAGGMDIVSQYIAFKKNIPFTKFALSVELVIILIAGVVGTIEIAVYTTIRLIISILVLDRIHTIYKYLKVEIITTEKDKMRETLISHFQHGITIYEVIGGYTNQKKWVLSSVVSSYEAEEYRNLAKQIDSKCFVTYTAIKQIYGLFNRKTIT